jgi:hypothetical protein
MMTMIIHDAADGVKRTGEAMVLVIWKNGVASDVTWSLLVRDGLHVSRYCI